MKNIKIIEFLMGLSFASVLIGLALLGLTLGNSLTTGIPMNKHTLFMPGIICISAGVLNLIPIILSNVSQPKNKRP